MLDFLQEEDEERKVEYIELIYDLIFVHAISRCGSMLELEHGIPGRAAYVTFLLFSLAVLEIWSSSSLFINRFPTHKGQRDICIFVNMYFMYYLAEGIHADWRLHYYKMHVAWVLILLHLAAQYWFALRHAEEREQYLRSEIQLLLTQAAIVALSIPFFALTRATMSPLALFTAVGFALTAEKSEGRAVDFPHLTERLMLYVVFSFGEMIVEMAGFFSEGVNIESIFHCLLALSFAWGLFLSYGYMYDNIIDRERSTSGDGYLLLHLVLIISLSYMTQMMGMLRNPLVPAGSKVLSITAWLVVYVVFLCFLERYAKERAGARYYIRLAQITGAYVFMSFLTRDHAIVNFAVMVGYIFAVYGSLKVFHRRKIAKKPNAARAEVPASVAAEIPAAVTAEIPAAVTAEIPASTSEDSAVEESEHAEEAVTVNTPANV